MAKKKTTATRKQTTTNTKETTAKKKQSTASKKPATAKKKPATANKKPTTAKKQTLSVKDRLAELQKYLTPDTQNETPDIDLGSEPADIRTLYKAHEPHLALLPQQFMSGVLDTLFELINDFQVIADNNLTPNQRRRKFGAGVRNYGFIEKVSDLAIANPTYATFFEYNDLRNAIKNIDLCRDIVLAAQGFARMVSNTMLVYSDEAFTMALIFYNTVRQMARRGDPIATQLFNTLQPFFRRRRQPKEEPTTKELERDLHALLHGKKDGEIIVKNVSPVTSKGVRTVVDDVHKSKAMIKEQAEAQVDN
jgi:hypothetical protein